GIAVAGKNERAVRCRDCRIDYDVRRVARNRGRLQRQRVAVRPCDGFDTVMVPFVVAITFALASAFWRSVVLRTEFAAEFVGLKVFGSPPKRFRCWSRRVRSWDCSDPGATCRSGPCL